MSRVMYALALLLVVATVHATYIDRMLPPLARPATAPVHFFTNAATLGQWTAEPTDTCVLQALAPCCATAATGFCGGAAPNTYTALPYALPGQTPAAASVNYPVSGAAGTMCLRPAITCTTYTRTRTIDLTGVDYAYLIPFIDAGLVTSMHFDVWAEADNLNEQLEVYIKFQTAAGVDLFTNTRDTKFDWTLAANVKKWSIIQTDYITPPVGTRKIVIGFRAIRNNAANRIFVPIMGAELYAAIDEVCGTTTPCGDATQSCTPVEDPTLNNNIWFDDITTSRTCACKLGLAVDPLYNAAAPVAGHLVRCIDTLAECPAAATPGVWPAHVPANRQCDTNAKCTQTLPMADGWFKCTCNAGYRDEGHAEIGDCKEINECLEGGHNCDPVAQCTNTIGSYTCTCPAGFTDTSGALGAGRVCTNIDECAAHTSNCNAQATCTDATPVVLTKPTLAAPATAWTWSDRWTCKCNTGYVGNGNTICNIDGCGSCGEHGHCVQDASTLWVRTCVCEDNTFFKVVNGKCVDVDECAAGTSQCNLVTSICHNTHKYFSHFTNPIAYTGPVWYGATCECRKGYKWDEATHSCVDIQECKRQDWGDNGGCDKHATCNEQLNAVRPTCTCNWGYSGNGRTCTEIDECAAGTHDCGAQTTCTNIAPKWDTTLTPAAWVGWTCACNAGYVSYNNKNCLLNECATNNGGCSIHAKCTPSGMDSTAPRDMVCQCNDGYKTDAGVLAGVNNPGDQCTEVDECQEGTDDCDVRADRYACVNIAPQWDSATSTWKKWICRCPPGFYGNGKRCELLDDEECVHDPNNANGKCDVKTAECTATGYLAFRTGGTRAAPVWAFPTYPIGNANRGRTRCTCKPGYKNLVNLNGAATPLHEDVDGVWQGVIAQSTACDDINECRTLGYHTYQWYDKSTNAIVNKDFNYPCINYDLGATPVDPHSHCDNQPGHYHCGCNDGWTGDAWRSYATPGVFNPLNRLAQNEQYDPINHCHAAKKALIHEYAIPIVFSILGFIFMIFVCVDGMFAAKGMVASPRPAIRWTIFILSLLLFIFSICMLINDIWPLGVNWIFFGAFAMGAAMANNYVLLFVSGILNAIGFFQSTATVFAIRSDVNKNIVDQFNARRCEEYYHYAHTWSLTEDRCDDSDYLGWLRAISVFYIIVMFVISYFSFLYTCIMRNAEIRVVYKKPQAPSSL